MSSRNTSHLAGEFLVAGELSRRGYPVSITMGNAKAVDIHADTQKGTIRVDAKASQYNTSWPISEVKDNVFYIFVFLRKEDKLRNESKSNKTTPPEYFIVSGKDISSKHFIEPWKNIPGIKYRTLNTSEHKERWDKLPPPD